MLVASSIHVRFTRRSTSPMHLTIAWNALASERGACPDLTYEMLRTCPVCGRLPGGRIFATLPRAEPIAWLRHRSHQEQLVVFSTLRPDPHRCVRCHVTRHSALVLLREGVRAYALAVQAPATNFEPRPRGSTPPPPKHCGIHGGRRSTADRGRRRGTAAPARLLPSHCMCADGAAQCPGPAPMRGPLCQPHHLVWAVP